MKNININYLITYGTRKFLLLCSPELVPQITGGVIPPEDTEKVSVRHCEASDWMSPVLAAVSSPVLVLKADCEEVWGPVMTKVVKSSLS